MDILKNSRVAVLGVGGVGGYVCEALVRSGVTAKIQLVMKCQMEGVPIINSMGAGNI